MEYRNLITSQWWSKKALAYQAFDRLKHIITFAYKHVPYYKESFDKLGVKPQSIKAPEDVRLLPILTKNDVQHNFAKLRTDTSYLEDSRIANTSGSTGTPIEFYISKHVDQIEYSYLWRQWNWAGFKYGDRAVVVRGQKLNEKVNGYPPFKVDHINGRKNLYISSYHLNEENLKKYFGIMIKFRPTIIRAYPSTLDIITRFAQTSCCEIPRVCSIITASETLLDSVRKRAESFWNCKVYDWYGQREHVAAAGQCEYGSYHICDEYSYVELIDVGSDLVEIVGSSFNNKAMPLIRYKTGDLARKYDQVCPCGRGLRTLNSIEGRTSQALLTMDGYWLFPSALQDVFEPCSNIRMWRVVQRELDNIEIDIVPSDLFSDKDVIKLETSMRQLLGENIHLSIRIVPDIDPGPTGKRQIVVSYLPAPFS